MDIVWFKTSVVPKLENCQIEYHSFANGDFGDLERVELEKAGIGVTLDFWSLGWLGIHAISYKSGEEIINLLLEPDEKGKKEEVFRKLENVLR